MPGVEVADDADPDAVRGCSRYAGRAGARHQPAAARRAGRAGGAGAAAGRRVGGRACSDAAGTAPSFDLDTHADRVAEVCGLLGGLPLGLTLAAGRLRVVGLDRLRTGLSSSLDLVADLGDALQWSLDRLDAGPRDLLERLAVFSGPVPLDAVEAVADDPDAVDALTTLVEGGLVRVDEAAAEPRYALPHPVRLLARRSLENGDRASAAHQAMAAYLLARTADWRDGSTPRTDRTCWPRSPRRRQTSSRRRRRHPRGPHRHRARPGAGRRAAVDRRRPGGPGTRAVRQLLERLPEDDPRAARLHAVLGRLAYHLTEWPAAETELRTALRLGDGGRATRWRCHRPRAT